MKTTILSIYCVLFITSAFSQNLTFGIQSHINLNFTDDFSNSEIISQLIPRYGFGIVVLHDLNQKIKTIKYGNVQRRADIFMKYGLNYVSRAYGYEFQNDFVTHEHRTVEIPIALLLKVDNPIARRWNKKGINAIAELGIKGTYSDPTTYRSLIGSMDNPKYILENGEKGGINLLITERIGFIQILSNGSQMIISLTANIGIFDIVTSSLELHTNKGISTETLIYNGGYFSLDCTYLFGKTTKHKVVKPVIFCPGF